MTVAKEKTLPTYKEGDPAEREMRDKQHAEDLSVLTTESDFLDFTPIWNDTFDVFICVGERVGGKTYGVLKHCLEDYKKTGKRFAYVRRWDKTISKKFIGDLLDAFKYNPYVKTQLIDDLWGPTYAMRYRVGKFEVFDTADETEFVPEVVGYVCALNTAASIKSVFSEADNIYNIVLDEFLPMSSERMVPDEYDAYEGLLSTLGRAHLDSCKVYLVGNSICKWSEYLYRHGVTYDMMDEKNQGRIQKIVLPEDADHAECKVTFMFCKPNPKMAKKNSKFIRKSRMSIGKGWEMKITACIPYIQGEVASEKLICTLFDPIMGKNLGFFLRTAQHTQTEDVFGLKVQKKYTKQFIVVRQTNRVSSYYNLTTVKGLGRNNWNNINKMFKDIKENLDIDIDDEILHTRVFAENFETGDILFKLYDAYGKITFKDTF